MRALGAVVVLEGAGATYPLRVDSLERVSSHRNEPKRPLWQLLSVTPATETNPERAMVWVSDEYRPRFLKALRGIPRTHIFERKAVESRTGSQHREDPSRCPR